MSDDGEDQGKMADDWAAAMAEQGDSNGQEDIDAMFSQAGDDVQPAPMDEFTSSHTAVEGAPDLDVIMDIPVRISMEVGNTEISIRNLLQLNQGSVIELDRLAGEPLDVLVNGTLIAHGEVVVVNEKFGIRMTDVISPSERIKKLR
jgi:flagellar motor switch protein FliN/FliY